jgi:ribonuclease HI
MVEIYTDGAYSSSRNVGGWAFVVVKDGIKEDSGFGTVVNTTNNRMEIMACIKALEWIKAKEIKECILYTDSMYVIGTMTLNWKRKKNVDLWPTMFELAVDISISWTHVKGHAGNQFNELCDTLAVHGSHIVCNN